MVCGIREGSSCSLSLALLCHLLSFTSGSVSFVDEVRRCHWSLMMRAARPAFKDTLAADISKRAYQPHGPLFYLLFSLLKVELYAAAAAAAAITREPPPDTG